MTSIKADKPTKNERPDLDFTALPTQRCFERFLLFFRRPRLCPLCGENKYQVMETSSWTKIWNHYRCVHCHHVQSEVTAEF